MANGNEQLNIFIFWFVHYFGKFVIKTVSIVVLGKVLLGHVRQHLPDSCSLSGACGLHMMMRLG